MFWLGLLLGIVGTWGVREVFMGYPETPVGLKVLGRKNFAVVCAIGEALLPGGGEIPLSSAEARVPEFVDNYVAMAPTLTRRLMFMLFFLMEHATYLFAFTTHRLSDLDVDARIRYLDGWEKSRLYMRRLAFTSLRAIYGMAYLGCPDVEKAMGFRISDKCRDALIIRRPQ